MKFVSLSLGNLRRQCDKRALSKQDSWPLVPSTHQCRRWRVKTNFIIAITSFTATRPSSYRSLMLERWISVEHLQPLLAHRRRRLPSTYDFILRFSPGHVSDHLPSLVFCHSYESLFFVHRIATNLMLDENTQMDLKRHYIFWTYVLSVFHVENTEHILPVSAINSHQLNCLRKWVSATYNAYHNIKITIPLTKIKFRPIFFKNQINDSSICPKFFEPSFILFYEPSLSSSFILNYVIRCQHRDFITTIEILS